MRFVGFIGPSYKARSVNFDCQSCINWYPEINEIGSGKEREVAALIPTPGLRALVTIGTGPIRATYTASNGQLYAVSKNKVYHVSNAWAATEIGTLNTNAGPVSMADNGIEIMLVDGEFGYVVNLEDNAFSEITDEDFPGADVVVFQDGYFIFNISGTGKFGITNLNSTEIDALDFTVSDGNPDKVLSIISDHRDLYVFNEKTIEVFFNSGNADFPFERIQGAFIEHGIAAPFTAAKGNNTVFWLGRSENGAGIVYMAQGYQPQRISTHAVEFAIQSYGDVSTATGYTYQHDGHFFYVLNFPNAKTTWVFDSTTGLWHERAYLFQGQLDRHRAETHAFAYAKHIVGDYETGKLYELTNEVYTDDGSPIMRRRAAPHMSDGLTKLFCSRFQLDMETGIGLDGVGQGTNPQVMLDFSDDGGHTWKCETWRSAGKIGETKHRVIWTRLGSFRDRVWRVTITDPVKAILLGAEVSIEKGTG